MGLNSAKHAYTGLNGASCPLGHVVHQGMLSNGASCPTGHVVHLGMLSTMACRPPGHVVHRDMSSTGACRPLGHVVHRGMLFPGHIVLGHTVTQGILSTCLRGMLSPGA